MIYKLVLFFIVVGCGSAEHINKENKKNCLIQNKEDIRSSYKSFVKDFSTEFDTISFDDNTSKYAKALNNTNFSWVEKTGFISKKNKGNFYTKCYMFGDSSSCSLAFKKWLQNFGTLAVPIEEGRKLSEINSPPVFALKTETVILILFSDCELQQVKTEKIKKNFKKILLDKSVNYLECFCGGPIKWY